MTKENIIKLHKHLCFLAKGDFKSRDFDRTYGDDENAGSMRLGKLSSTRKDLIISDAKRHLAVLEFKHPELKASVKAPINKDTKKNI